MSVSFDFLCINRFKGSPSSSFVWSKVNQIADLGGRWVLRWLWFQSREDVVLLVLASKFGPRPNFYGVSGSVQGVSEDLNRVKNFDMGRSWVVYFHMAVLILSCEEGDDFVCDGDFTCPDMSDEKVELLVPVWSLVARFLHECPWHLVAIFLILDLSLGEFWLWDVVVLEFCGWSCLANSSFRICFPLLGA